MKRRGRRTRTGSSRIYSSASSRLYSAIEDPKTLADELRGNSILRKDVESAISVVSPYIPLIGLLGGVAITGRHIYQHKSKQKLPPAENMQIQSDGS